MIDDVLAGLRAGADDYISKPSNVEELQARVAIGVRIIELQKSLVDRVREMEGALREVKQLQGILPICAYCQKIRDDQNYWQRVEQYISEHTDAHFSHSVCPECYAQVVQPQLDELKRKQKEK